MQLRLEVMEEEKEKEEEEEEEEKEEEEEEAASLAPLLVGLLAPVWALVVAWEAAMVVEEAGEAAWGAAMVVEKAAAEGAKAARGSAVATARRGSAVATARRGSAVATARIACTMAVAKGVAARGVERLTRMARTLHNVCTVQRRT